MNKRPAAWSLTCLLLTVMLASSSLAGTGNPKPEAGDLVLPMPGGGNMVFRPVFLGVGPEPFAAKEFKMGDRVGGGFKEYPTTVVLGGGFQGNSKSGKDWLYYIGKYEVMQDQFAAVMGTVAEKPGYPKNMISLFEAQEFIHKYNLWLFANAKDKLPKQEEAVGFVRLPTEAEWEFAARGGSVSSRNSFDRKHPYPKQINRFEWYSGPTSSHDKLKKAGMLKPNHLGIHDMLGNVSEITTSLYQVEYYQGRPGGFVARGGSFRTPLKSLRSSLRTEMPFYRNDKATVQDEMGFRLVLSSPIYASRQTSSTLAAAWETYRTVRPTPTTAAASVSPTSVKTSFQLNDMIDTVDRLQKELAGQSVTDAARDQAGLIKASFGNISAIVLKAEQDSAESWSRMASFIGWFLVRELKKIPASEAVLEITRQHGTADELERFQGRHQVLLKNIEGGLDQYGLIIGELGKLQASAVKRGFAKYEKYLIQSGAAEQIKVNRVALEHATEYTASQRVNIEKWKADLGKL